MMSTASPVVLAPAIPGEHDHETTWLEWLRANVDTEWRPNEWQHEFWLFTGSVDEPGTSTKYCDVQACDRIISRGNRCSVCKPAFQVSEMSGEEFNRTYVPIRVRQITPAYNRGGRDCAVVGAKGSCPRNAISIGLCTYHYHGWRKAVNADPGLQFDVWTTSGQVKIPRLGRLPACQVPGCDRDARTRKKMLCETHLRWHRNDNYPEPVDEWAKVQTPTVVDHQFSLIGLDERLRWEILYAVQQRDARGGRVEPHAMRSVIQAVRDLPSLATMSITEEAAHTNLKRESNTNAHLAEFARHLRNGYDQMMGIGPKDHLVWDLVEAGISRDPSLIGGTRRRSGLDFRPVTQPWLQSIALAWGREQSSPTKISETVRAAICASQVLSRRGDNGDVVSVLDRSDVHAITDGIGELNAVRGGSLSAKHRRRLYQRFFNLIEWGRRNGHLDHLQLSFIPLPLEYIRSDDFGEEEQEGKAIPDEVQRQLDGQVNTIGRNLNYGALTDDEAQQMFRTVYIILRDTGRRPLEVATLKIDCLAHDSNGPILVWDNHKAKRYGRKLPILSSTADAIRHWLQLRPHINAPARSDEYLFPTIDARSGESHMRSYSIARAIRMWVDRLPRLDSGNLDDEGNPIQFDRSLIYPYAFRHSFAQRHADGGTPIDVLRDLMDHASIKTTSGYYTITADRKRNAISTVGGFVTDRFGNPDPNLNATTYQMRSVAVPFGNCAEPANVKAGGQSCPIRFQCAGCGYYRPDPSYIPAIEQHLTTLRADREIAEAMNVANYVTENLTSQIDSFSSVLESIKGRLASLDSAERKQIEEASTTLRRARAGELLPLSVVRAD